MASSLTSSVASSEFPFILRPKFKPILLKCINMLPPKAFLQLAATCSEMRTICYTSPEVCVKVRLIIFIEEEENETKFVFLPSEGKRIQWRKMKELLKLPFIFHVPFLNFNNGTMNNTTIFATRFILQQLKIVKFTWLIAEAKMKGDWDELVSLAKDYQVSILVIDDEIPKQQLKEICQLKLKQLTYKSTQIPDENFKGMQIESLEIMAKLRKTTAENFLERWLSKTLEISEYKIGQCALSQMEIHSIMRRYPLVYYHEFNGDLPKTRPLVVVKEENEQKYYFLLRDDDKILNLFLGRNGFLHLGTINFSHHLKLFETL